MKLLLIEQVEKGNDSLAKTLKQHHNSLDVVADGTSGLELLEVKDRFAGPLGCKFWFSCRIVVKERLFIPGVLKEI